MVVRWTNIYSGRREITLLYSKSAVTVGYKNVLSKVLFLPIQAMQAIIMDRIDSRRKQTTSKNHFF